MCNALAKSLPAYILFCPLPSFRSLAALRDGPLYVYLGDWCRWIPRPQASSGEARYSTSRHLSEAAWPGPSALRIVCLVYRSVI